MADSLGIGVAKSAIDIIKGGDIVNKMTEGLGVLFPYIGIENKAVDIYIKEIEQSDLPTKTKILLILNTKKTFKKLMNQKAIAEIAITNSKYVVGDNEKSSIQEDWLDRFMDSAGYVSSADIQLIWGRILANELDEPGSTPPNMIRILSEITPKIAKAFRKICSMTVFVFDLDETGEYNKGYRHLFVPFKENEDLFREMEIDFSILNELEALGVIRFDSLTGYVSKGFESKEIIVGIDGNLVMYTYSSNPGFPIGDVLLTTAGEALQSITDAVEIDGYYEMVNSYLAKKGVNSKQEPAYMLEYIDGELTVKKKCVN